MAHPTWSVQDAKNRFSEVVEAARRKPQTVTKHGKPAVVGLRPTSTNACDTWIGRRHHRSRNFCLPYRRTAGNSRGFRCVRGT